MSASWLWIPPPCLPIFIGGTDAEAEALILWPSDVKSQFTGKHPDAGKDRGQEKRVTEEIINRKINSHLNFIFLPS